MLYRYAALASPSSAGILTDKAFDVLTRANQSYRPEFSWEDVVHFKPEPFNLLNCSSFMTDTSDDKDQADSPTYHTRRTDTDYVMESSGSMPVAIRRTATRTPEGDGDGVRIRRQD